jgi:hypothetical protein
VTQAHTYHILGLRIYHILGLRTVPYYGYGRMSLRVKAGSPVPLPVPYVGWSNLKMGRYGSLHGGIMGYGCT